MLDGYILATAVTHFKLKDFDDSPVPPGMPKSLEATWFHDKVFKHGGQVCSLVDRNQETCFGLDQCCTV